MMQMMTASSGSASKVGIFFVIMRAAMITNAMMIRIPCAIV